MSTERRPARLGSFGGALAITVAGLLVLGGAGAAVSLTQGPRASSVAVDTEAIAEASGQRVVFTLNQALATVDADQVSVSPAAPFSVVGSGRHLAVQFTYPLDPDTSYTVAVEEVRGASGGPTSELTHSFTTAAPPVFVLQRREGADDAIFGTNLAGDQAVPVFTDPQIEDFRATRTSLVVQTTQDDAARLLTLPRIGGDAVELAMPGTGAIGGLQVADHDGLVGYVYTDAAVGTPGALESTLFISRLDEPGAEPVRIEVGEDPRVVQYAFVPQTSYLLVFSYDGQLRLIDTGDLEAEPVLLGAAVSILGVEQGSGRVIVQRPDTVEVIDLTTLAETPFVSAGAATELPDLIAPTVEGATLRVQTELDETGYPASRAVVRVDAEGDAVPVFEPATMDDGIVQLCASPSGRYAAVTVAPDLVDNPYDTYQQPLPQELETHIIDLVEAETTSVIAGSSVSWCTFAW